MSTFPTLGRPDVRRTTSRPVRAAMSSPAVVLAVGFAIAYGFAGPEYLVFTATSAVPIAITSLGLLVLVGWVRDISLATAGMYGAAIYLFGHMARRPEDGPGTIGAGGIEGWGLPWIMAGTLIVIGGALTMGLVALASSRLPGIYLVVLTLALQVIIERTIFTYDYAGGLSGGDSRGNILSTPMPSFLGLDLSNDTNFYLFSLGWLGLVLVLMARLRRSPIGLAFHLVGADRQAAAAVGVNPVRFRIYAFAISGALAGLAGMIGAWYYENPPIFINYLSPISLVLLAIPILAGLDSIAFIVVIAAAFQLTPVILEGARISPFLLAAVGLLSGAAVGSRGLGGRVSDGWRYFLHGPRRLRTSRERVRAALLRASEGLAHPADGVPLSTLPPADRAAALAVLESWLPPRPQGDQAVEARDVSVSFGAVRALDGASISVPNQAMVGLLGPNGAGKSTLFDVISGVRRPDSGTVSLFGHDVTGTPAWDRAKLGVARTFQSTRVMTDLTVAENLLAGAYQRISAHPLRFLAGDPRAWRQLRAAEDAAWAAAQLLDIDRYWNERAGTLEFSARRRAEIGRCLLSGPRLLLLDEPAAGLDPASSVALFSLLKQLHADLGLTVLLVEHYVKAVLDSCDFVYVLAEGRVLSAGSPSKVANDANVRERYLGTRMRYVPRSSAGSGPASAQRLSLESR